MGRFFYAATRRRRERGGEGESGEWETQRLRDGETKGLRDEGTERLRD
jgi:hypothetical protein